MRWSEIINEASTPKEVVNCYDCTSSEEGMIEIGGRWLASHNQPIEKTLRGINLKNVKSKHGPLLFHGTIAGDITHFKDGSWFSAEPYTAITHASFWKAISMGNEAFIYVCNATYKNPDMNPRWEPGHEGKGDIKNFYAETDYDAIIWKDTRDVIMPITDLYNIRSGDQITILKKWEVKTIDVSETVIKKMIALHKEGKDPLDGLHEPKEEKKPGPNDKWVVVDPGLSPLEKGDFIDQEHYEEFKDYIEVEPIHS